ncbi:MAG: hypothetical protein ACJ8LM_04830 [Candidatus Udaeobacter sp.]
MSVDVVAIAGRYALREGCRFINYQAVGIEVFAMNVRALVLEQRPVPPIAEFLLRFMLDDIGQLKSLSQLLGLDQSIVRNNLIDLRCDELIEIRGEDNTDDIQCVLTDRGREAARSLRQNIMQEITLPKVIFHGLLRRPLSLGEQAKRQYLKPKEASDQGLVLVRAIPNLPPRPDEVDVDQLDRVVKSGFRRRPDDPVRDIVSVKSILKNVSTLYEPAVMLEYETEDIRRERQVAFAVEGRRLDEYEMAFAKARGPELLAEVMTPRDEPLKERVRRLVPEPVLSRLGKIDDVEILSSQVAVARQELADAQQKLQESDRADTRLVLRDTIAKLEQDRDRLENERNSRKVKYLWTPEIRNKLWEALETAQERLLILSGYISSEVVNDGFVATLRTALQRGVKAWIGYGFDKVSQRGRETRSSPKWREAEKAFQELKKEFPDRFEFRDVARSHEKRLICDSRFTFGGSFNLLSFTGENLGPGNTRHEGADLIEDAAFCEELWSRYLRLFFN